PALDEKQIREVKALMRDPSVNITNVAERYKVSRTTLYKYAGQ
ncbi:MAG: helix-turn-helix domain-containing protein, partial [Methylococcaceae bacterium]